MPLASCMQYVRDTLDGLAMPAGMNVPAVAAWITAPDPDVDPAAVPTVYIWPLPGSEQRALGSGGGTIPRNAGPGTPSGFKTIKHEIGLWLVWPQAEDDPDADMLFPGYIDALMAALRTAFPMPCTLTDPWTGWQTTLMNVGEMMRYDSPPPRAVADQRYLEYRALIGVPILEQIQA